MANAEHLALVVQRESWKKWPREKPLVAPDLRKADLGGADLFEANLSLANLRGANLRKARMRETIFGDTDLRDLEGAEQCTFVGPCTLDHRTLQRSGRLPLSFLRGCGLPDTLIEYLPSILNEAIQFFSCFISYSTKDQQFAERLHADLQAKGIRCWFAPEDLKIGDKFRTRIDESIRIHDKLLLILSENSIVSPWVEDEVESALKRERRDGKLVLFPVRLDHAVMDTAVAWAAALRRTRHVGDFAQWKDHDAYSKTFERLLRDLNSNKAKA